MLVLFISFISLFHPEIFLKFALFDVIYVLLLQLIELENYDIFFRVYLKEEEEKNGTIHHGGISLGCLSSNALLCYTGPKLEGCSFQAHFENKNTSRK